MFLVNSFYIITQYIYKKNYFGGKDHETRDVAADCEKHQLHVRKRPFPEDGHNQKVYSKSRKQWGKSNNGGTSQVYPSIRYEGRNHTEFSGKD